ncbi:hypothetical protein AKJ09_05067 [Labilithrix luteola]|uniref:Uncharacterized protein n=1 Tax=Labilithrix luteola TaxID=1391654 RepID=A0A0K1PXZ5_9BACT|nr:hypothetical protein [Labilithrix luteola]AKU98403.1 hypothetical protein AKJ09_05067 [Labilithrix luteola]
MRRKTSLVILAAVAACIALAFVSKRERETLANSSAVAEDLAVLAQSLDAPLEGLGLAWLPDSALALKPIAANIGPDGGWLSAGRDGPYYALRRLDADAGEHSSTSSWTFTVQRGGGAEPKATHVTLPVDRKISMDAFIDHAMTVYARRLTKEPEVLANHFLRVEFAFRFRDRQAARALLADSVARAPQLSEPRIALALVDAADARTDGLRDLEHWAATAPSYRRRTDVALTHWMLHHTDEAIAAMREAMTLPLTAEKLQNLNASARAMPIAEMALAQRRYEATHDIAARLEEGEPDAYTRERFAHDWRALRAAALYHQGDHAAAVALVADGLVESDPFYRRGDDARPKLALAIRSNDSDAVEAWKPNGNADIIGTLFSGVNLVQRLGLPRPE